MPTLLLHLREVARRKVKAARWVTNFLNAFLNQEVWNSPCLVGWCVVAVQENISMASLRASLSNRIEHPRQAVIDVLFGSDRPLRYKWYSDDMTRPGYKSCHQCSLQNFCDGAVLTGVSSTLTAAWFPDTLNFRHHYWSNIQYWTDQYRGTIALACLSGPVSACMPHVWHPTSRNLAKKLFMHDSSEHFPMRCPTSSASSWPSPANLSPLWSAQQQHFLLWLMKEACQSASCLQATVVHIEIPPSRTKTRPWRSLISKCCF